MYISGLILLIISAGIYGTPLRSEGSPEQQSNPILRLQRYLRVPRQAPDVGCTTQDDCLPTDLQGTGVPGGLVTCNNEGVCECNDCFMLRPEEGTCFNCSDYQYFASNSTCGDDVRQDQRRAFVLSFFLSSTGAANFYIESYGLAVGQLVVLIVFLASVCIVIFPCCICCDCVCKEGVIKGTCLFILLFVLSIVFVIVMGMLIVSWWVGEMAIFANNERLTGSGCFLRENL